MKNKKIEEITPEGVNLKASEENEKVWHDLTRFFLLCQERGLLPGEYRTILNTLNLEKDLTITETLGRRVEEKFNPVKRKKKLWHESLQFLLSCRKAGMSPEDYRMILDTLDLQEKREKVKREDGEEASRITREKEEWLKQCPRQVTLSGKIIGN